MEEMKKPFEKFPGDEGVDLDVTIDKNTFSAVEEKTEPWKRQPFTIDENVEIDLPNACNKFPEIMKLQVNQSIFVPGDKTSKQFVACARRYAKRAGWKIASRKAGSGLRVFRIS